ncbi:uncharacterized protein Dmoj_GI26321 [Drosophila mojavensis]|uniref:Uncharacterized protein n=1 Tax=Drosophila mojavensis TaxID=7230 RepID=A0A0Q9XD19_DROMO|nr:uncharacterized protein Dmoj_GI26321 [Drosophila mojavensis]
MFDLEQLTHSCIEQTECEENVQDGLNRLAEVHTYLGDLLSCSLYTISLWSAVTLLLQRAELPWPDRAS